MSLGYLHYITVITLKNLDTKYIRLKKRSKAMSVTNFGGFIFKFYAVSIGGLVLVNAISTF
jgi:hypothetical protein